MCLRPVLGSIKEGRSDEGAARSVLRLCRLDDNALLPLRVSMADARQRSSFTRGFNGRPDCTDCSHSARSRDRIRNPNSGVGLRHHGLQMLVPLGQCPENAGGVPACPHCSQQKSPIRCRAAAPQRQPYEAWWTSSFSLCASVPRRIGCACRLFLASQRQSRVSEALRRSSIGQG